MERPLQKSGIVLLLGSAGSLVAVGPVLGATGAEADQTSIFFATSEIAQVMLSIAAVSFAILAARLYGGEIGKAIYTVSGGVILFSIWQLLNGASNLVQVQSPPAQVGSTVNLIVTVLLLAGFYMLYETIHGATTA